MGGLGFTLPWLLVGLVALPILWWLLRAVPPAPVRKRFPALTLLLGLEDERVETRTTPWWLLMLRLLAVAGLIIGFAGPVLNPEKSARDTGPLVVLIDAFWPAAGDWTSRVEAVDALLQESQQGGRQVAVMLAHETTPATLSSAQVWRERLAAMQPVAWDAPYEVAVLDSLPTGQTIWLSDGIEREGRGEVLTSRKTAGEIQIWQKEQVALGLTPPRLEEGEVKLRALRSRSDGEYQVQLTGFGPDPAGQLRALAKTELSFPAGDAEVLHTLSLPPELRHRIQWFSVTELDVDAAAAPALSAGQVALVGEALTRRRVVLLGGQESETLALLSPDHFLRAALAPHSEIVDALRLEDALRASPHAVILPDVVDIAEPDQRALAKWVAQGGLLLRFAGPRLAAAQSSRRDVVSSPEDVLLPVRLRGAGRTVGGAMSWGAPQKIAPFSPDSPFYGLPIPDEVSVSRQVLAEPGPDLADRTLARLADGTPLVTRKLIGSGQVVLIHVGANAEWSSLVLSGLFVDMLGRLTAATAITPLTDQGGDFEADASPWQREQLLSAHGQLKPEDPPAQIAGADLQSAVQARGTADAPPGVYGNGSRQIVVNALAAEAVLAPAVWPAEINPEWRGVSPVKDLSGLVLGAALIVILADILATLRLTGRWPLRGAKGAGVRAGAIVVLALVLGADPVSAQSNPPEDLQVEGQVISAAAEVTLAHVITGDADLDALARAGLAGLSDALYLRSSVEPAPPVGVDLEEDELSVYPILYWPISPSQPLPSADAYARLAQYLSAGGLILFDTRDAGTGGGGAEMRKLQALAAPLSLPPLDPVPTDHVLTRAFYLIDVFPGRYTGPVWAEAAPPGAVAREDLPFRLLNDGVTPVLIGGNDWAGAWAVGPNGAPLLPVGRGQAGERQREMALRFGINLVMHVLTGNYKSDQVHVPTLLQRLGQ